MAGRLLNITYDCILVLLTWVMAGAIVSPTSATEVSPAVLAMAAVATSPLLMPINSRVKSMGGRTFGNLFVLGYMLSVWASIQGHFVVGLLGMSLFGMLIVMSSKFALQFIVLTSPVVALLCGSWWPLLGVVCVAVCVLCVPGLGLKDIVSFMWVHTRWYIRNYQTVSSVSYRNRFRDLLNLPRYFRESNGEFWGVLFRRSSYFIALYSFPVVWVVPFLAPSIPVHGDQVSLLGFGVVVVAAAVVVFVLTSTRYLLFLGQAERYLEYSLPFAACLFAMAYAEGTISLSLALAVILFQIAMSLANLTYGHYAAVRSVLEPKVSNEKYSFIQNFNGKNILTVPIKMAFQLSYEDLGANSYYYRAINVPGEGFAYLERDLAWFEMPRPDLRYFSEKYGIDTVVVDKSFLPRAEGRGVVYPLEDYETLFENNQFLVKSIRDASHDEEKEE